MIPNLRCGDRRSGALDEIEELLLWLIDDARVLSDEITYQFNCRQLAEEYAKKIMEKAHPTPPETSHDRG